MPDNVVDLNAIRLVRERNRSNPDPNARRSSSNLLDLDDTLSTYRIDAEFLEALVLHCRHRFGRTERYGLFEVQHVLCGAMKVEQLYFPQKYLIPELTRGIVYRFTVTPGHHPETGECVTVLRSVYPIVRLI